MINIEKINQSILWHYENYLLFPLYNITQNLRVKRMRNKNLINVLFIVTEVGAWKTKELYEAMLAHPRFKPTLGISMSLERPTEKINLISFLKTKQYTYIDLDTDTFFQNQSPDIIFYQKPYDWCYKSNLLFKNHLNSLFCHVHYAFHSNETIWAINQPLYKLVWQQYFENSMAANPQRLSMMEDHGKQVVVTGLPIQDQLMLPKTAFADPWKKQNKAKKRIIYAPHHTIGNQHLKGLALSSFLENCDVILGLMHKYSDSVQWAFKPHPLLYGKLLSIWGKVKTDSYYDEWRNSENSQFEDGAYDALFKYSDAMIHDCSSFTIEYHYTQNPVMFLTRNTGAENSRNEFAQKAYNLHYIGTTNEQIENFIRDVINGIDPLKMERTKFYKECLVPPYGKKACENIINAILGISEYK